MHAYTIPPGSSHNPTFRNARSFLFSIRRFGSTPATGNCRYRKDADYRIVFAAKGELEYRLGAASVVLPESTVGIIRPSENFREPQYVTGEGFIITVSRELLQLRMSSSGLLEAIHLRLDDNQQISLSPDDAIFLNELLTRLHAEYSIDECSAEIIETLFQVFALYISRTITRLNPLIRSRCQHHTNLFLTLLDQHFTTLKMPSGYADLMAVTPGYLNNVIRETLGNTTTHYIQQRIMREAKRLMVSEGLSLKEAGYKLGFPDVSHFSKFFKKITGQRYSDFKRNLAA